MLLQSTGAGQYATRLVSILHPRIPTEEEKLSCGVTQTVPLSAATRDVTDRDAMSVN
jgi:hypothetical protein